MIPQRSTDELLALIAEQAQRIAALQWSEELSMFNQSGLMDAIDRLPEGNYVVVFADIDRLKTINSATGSHTATNRYLRDGLRVRCGEIAGQLYGDEIVFVLDSSADARAFVGRISRQMASQPLTAHERAALAVAQGVTPDRAVLSATFAYAGDVPSDQIRCAIGRLSADVLSRKAARDRARV